MVDSHTKRQTIGSLLNSVYSNESKTEQILFSLSNNVVEEVSISFV